MQAMLLRRWTQRFLVAASISVLLPAVVLAGWPWSRPAPPPVTPVGPPIYTPTAPPTVVNYQPATVVPQNPVPAAVPPTLGAPPATYAAPAVVAPAPAVVAAPAVAAPCATCAPQRVTAGYVPPNYHTSFMQVPTTTYRPVASIDPATGLPINAVAACTTTAHYAYRQPTSWWGGLWSRSAPPPTVVAYTPATIAAYPAPAVVTNYAPTVIVPRAIPAPIVTTYAPPQTQIVSRYAPAPIVTQYAPAPVVTQYAPAPAPVVTQYAPAPVTTQYAPAPVVGAPGPIAPACPPETAAPNGAFPSTPGPGQYAPGTPPQAAPQGSTNGDAASVAPQLDPNDLNRRNYPPTQYDDPPMVPAQPPAERRVNEKPSIEQDKLETPPGDRSSATIRSPSPFIPFARPGERPASTKSPDRLRLVPDPDIAPLELRKHEIPNLIKPGDRST